MIWRKRCFGSQSDKGQRCVERILSIKETCRIKSKPSFPVLVDLAKAHFKDVENKEIFDEYFPLVNIPLIVAMWEPMARVLGYPGPIGWKDIANVAKNPDGWAAFDHPEWGKFRWGHAHPEANSGFLTIISEVYAACGKTENLRPEDLKNPNVVSFLRDF